MNSNLYAHIERAAPADLGDTVLFDSGAEMSWRALQEQTARFAALLRSLGLQRGDRVAAQVEKSPQSLFLYLACLRAGVVYLPLNTAYQRAELSYFLSDAQPRVVVCRPQSEAEVRGLAGAAEVLTLDEAGAGSLAGAARDQPVVFETAQVAADDLAAIIYTSGTTGRSKGAMLTHRNLLSNGRVLVQAWGFTAGDVLLHALPMFHVHGLFVANHCALLAGARMLWHRKFDARALLRDLPRATVLMGVPTFYTRLLAEPGFTAQACGGVRLFVSGSAPLLPDTFEEFERRTGQRILERYGMSEAGMICSNPLHGERRAGSVGPPLPGVSVRVADERDRPLPAGRVGGIQIRGENVFRGYWRMPEKTREEFSADGWFRTGDVGVFDADGYLSIVGREKDLIITGGYNVYPKEIELAIDALPGVLESAVVGLPHPDFGEAVTAVVVPRAGAVLSPEDIIQTLKRELANYKVPKRVILVPDLPRNAMGKVQKSVLRERYGAG
ncbi:MAG TPA: malonyl-CoA synthase [Burkholderiales bacterium]|nr:malonyl-CoA synthase [Burkholderiales bacterium]